MISGFKAFIMRGNVVDLAVGVVIGAAFGSIVTSFVNDVLMPPVGLLLGRADFSNLFVSLRGESFPSLAAAKAAGAPTLNYGLFFNTVINFLIVAAAVYVLVRAISHLMPPPPAPAPAATKECPRCVSVIPQRASRCPQCTSDLAVR